MVPCMGDEETEETKRKKTNTGSAKECNTNEEKKRCSAGIIYYTNLPWRDHYWSIDLRTSFDGLLNSQKRDVCRPGKNYEKTFSLI